jgi:hypothetical protein
MTDQNQEQEKTSFLDKCEICNGNKITYNMMPCSFCNETGLSNRFAEAFIRNHICYCSTTSDRKNCPVCKKKCHHDSALRPRILIVP